MAFDCALGANIAVSAITEGIRLQNVALCEVFLLFSKISHPESEICRSVAL